MYGNNSKVASVSEKEFSWENLDFCNPDYQYFFLPWYEVVLAAVYLALTQLTDGQGAAKDHMHATISFLEDFASLQQTLQGERKQSWEGGTSQK